MRWPALTLRIVGWLLTPLVAWAASFLGAWLILISAGRIATPRAILWLSLAAALLAGIATLLLWRQLLRRFPKLRQSLRVSTAGLPVIEETPPKGAHTTPSRPEDVA